MKTKGAKDKRKNGEKMEKLIKKNLENENEPICRFDDCVQEDEENCVLYYLKGNKCGMFKDMVEKLAEYESLENKLDGVSLKVIVDAFITNVEGSSQEDYSNARVLTNKESEKWQRWLQLEAENKLVELE